MEVIEVRDRTAIERFVTRHCALHLYELGDLDPFFWPQTTWYGAVDAGGELEALALVYRGTAVPTLISLRDDDDDDVAFVLLRSLASRLPPQLYAHLSTGLLPALGDRWTAQHQGRHLKMEQVDRAVLERSSPHLVVPLGPADRVELDQLYAQAYPGNWFDPRMLDSGQYFGIRVDGRLACAAGVHVYSPRYRVAALGNITTAPEARGQGLARAVTAHLCRSLYHRVDTIGLNVHTANATAIACYRRLGFVPVAEYDEYTLTEPAAG